MRPDLFVDEPDKLPRRSRAWIPGLSACGLLVASLPASAQSPLWMRQLGSSSRDQVWAVASDGVDRVYIGGWTEGSLGGPNAGVEDAWLASYDGSGILRWARQLGSSRMDVVNALAVGVVGDVFAGGYLDADPTGMGSWDAWLARYDSLGTQLWIRQLGGLYEDSLNAACADGSGGVFVGGLTAGSLGGPGLGSYDAWLARFDQAGTQMWLRQLGTSGSDAVHGSAPDGSTGVYVAGITTGALGGPPAGVHDAWVGRYDSGGSVLWLRQLGTSANDWTEGAAADGSGGVYVGGWTLGALGGVNAGGVDAWVARYDGLGNQLWVRQLGTSADDHAKALAPDGSGGAYVAGVTQGSLGGPSAGSTDAWLARYDAGGNLLWVHQLGTSTSDAAQAGASDSVGSLYLGGHSFGDLGGPNAGHFDAWLARYDGSCGPGSTYCTASATSITACQAGLGASGSPSLSKPSGFTITAGKVPGGNTGLCFFGRSGAKSSPFGTLGGQLCVQSPVIRSKPRPSGGTAGACDGQYSFTLQDLIDASPIIVSGAVLHAQVWATDPANPDGFVLSDGLQFTVCP